MLPIAQQLIADMREVWKSAAGDSASTPYLLLSTHVSLSLLVCECVCVCVRACVRACVIQY